MQCRIKDFSGSANLLFGIFFAENIGGPGGGATEMAPGVQILSFSYSFWQDNCKIIPLWELAPPQENERIWTEICNFSEIVGKDFQTHLSWLNKECYNRSSYLKHVAFVSDSVAGLSSLISGHFGPVPLGSCTIRRVLTIVSSDCPVTNDLFCTVQFDQPDTKQLRGSIHRL